MLRVVQFLPQQNGYADEVCAWSSENHSAFAICWITRSRIHRRLMRFFATRTSSSAVWRLCWLLTTRPPTTPSWKYSTGASNTNGAEFIRPVRFGFAGAAGERLTASVPPEEPPIV